MIVVVAIGLLDVPEFRRIAQVDRSELGLAILAAVIVVAVGMLAGIFSVVLLSLLLVAQQVAQPRTSVLVNVPVRGLTAASSRDWVESLRKGWCVSLRGAAHLRQRHALLGSVTQLVAASPPSVRLGDRQLRGRDKHRLDGRQRAFRCPRLPARQGRRAGAGAGQGPAARRARAGRPGRSDRSSSTSSWRWTMRSQRPPPQSRGWPQDRTPPAGTTRPAVLCHRVASALRVDHMMPSAFALAASKHLN